MLQIAASEGRWSLWMNEKEASLQNIGISEMNLLFPQSKIEMVLNTVKIFNIL